MHLRSCTLLILIVGPLVLLGAGCGQSTPVGGSEGSRLYMKYCASCHGPGLDGGSGGSLLDDVWRIGGERADLYKSIFDGIPQNGMPGYGQTLGAEGVNHLVDYILEVRAGGQSPATAPPEISSDNLETKDYVLNVDVFVDGLRTPWGMEFLDERRALVTEKDGPLRLILDGALVPEPIRGTPTDVHPQGQGGMLEVALHPDFGTNGWIYLAYSHRLSNGHAMTRVVRGQLDGMDWINQETIWEAPHNLYLNSTYHYGTRIAFGPEDGMLYFTIGDRGRQNNAQDLSLPNGKVHRVTPEGQIPPDNPFVETPGAMASIWSYGHRNQQGADFHPVTGDLWAVEHGPRGGDELNVVERGLNYGWPVITYGINYDGSTITHEKAREGMEQPVVHWTPSIAVGGARFYKGDEFPSWRNHLLVSALAYQEVRLLTISDRRVIEDEVILKNRGRIREALPGPDGAIYVIANNPDQILRLTSGGERQR